MTGSCGAPATGLPRFSLAADGSCRARQVPPVHIAFHPTKAVGKDTTQTGLSASAASERGAYGLWPTPKPSPHLAFASSSSAFERHVRRFAPLRLGARDSAWNRCDGVYRYGDPGNPSVCGMVRTLLPRGFLHRDFVDHITFRAPAYRRARMDQRAAATLGMPRAAPRVATRALYSYYTRYLFPSPTAGRTRAPL